MRTTTILSTLLVGAFLALAAGAALAQAPDNDRGAARREAIAEMREARNESLRQFHENRTAALDDYRASINATRASFLENKTAVIDGCREARSASAEDDDSAFAQCVRDGLKPLIEKARADHADARETLRERLLEARQDAIASFRAQKDEIRARHAGGRA